MASGKGRSTSGHEWRVEISALVCASSQREAEDLVGHWLDQPELAIASWTVTEPEENGGGDGLSHEQAEGGEHEGAEAQTATTAGARGAKSA